MLAYFGEVLGAKCGSCDNCIPVSPGLEAVDRTSEATQFLSCARLTDQIYGQEHLIQVLRGSQAEKIRRKGHDKLPVHGIGKHHSADEWQRLAENLVHSGLLDRDPDFGSLRLTGKGWAVLEGKEKFLFSERPPSFTVASTPSGPADTELFCKLKALRKRLADEHRVPAYVIFSDQSLLEMALRIPLTEAQFLLIHGVGKVKLANHGQQFLQLIREHSAHTSNTAAVCAPVSSAQIQRLPGSRSAEIAKLFLNGRAIEQIATAFQIKQATVVEHLYRFHQAGGKLEHKRILDESKLHISQQARVFEVFQQLGAERLSPIYEALGKAVPYEELHLLRLCWVTGHPGQHSRAI